VLTHTLTHTELLKMVLLASWTLPVLLKPFADTLAMEDVVPSFTLKDNNLGSVAE